MADKKISKINLSGESYAIDVATNLKAADILSTNKDETSKVATVGAVQKPDGVNALFDENNKINSHYISDIILGQLKFGGTLTSYNPSNGYTVNPSQLILSKLYELTNYPEDAASIDSLQLSIVGDPSIVSITMISNGEVKNGYDDNDGTAFEGFYFISAANLSDEYAVGDWLVINNKNFEKIDNTDTITHIKDADTSLLSIEGAGLKLDKITKNTKGEALVNTPDGEDKLAIVNVDYLETHTISELLDTGVKLSEDLYAYADIGKITDASNTNRKLVASAGDTLKTVFNNVFGTQQDVQPTITTSGVSLSVNAGTTSYGGGEFGTAVAKTDVTITFTLNNSATAQYGYRCGSTKTPTADAPFKYAITKQTNDADIKITLPSGQTATSSMVTAGTFKGADSNILYCNFNSSNKVSIKIQLAAGSVTASSQTRYGQIKGEVSLGAAQNTSGTTIDKFLTYLGNDATITSGYSGGTKSGTAGAYTISAGSKYTYWATSTTTDIPTTWTKYATSTSVTDLQLSCDAGEYIWVASTGNYTSFYAWNDASGKYNTDKLATTKSTSTVTIKNAQSVDASGYYLYRTTNAMLQNVDTKFKLA